MDRIKQGVATLIALAMLIAGVGVALWVLFNITLPFLFG